MCVGEVEKLYTDLPHPHETIPRRVDSTIFVFKGHFTLSRPLERDHDTRTRDHDVSEPTINFDADLADPGFGDAQIHSTYQTTISALYKIAPCPVLIELASEIDEYIPQV